MELKGIVVDQVARMTPYERGVRWPWNLLKASLSEPMPKKREQNRANQGGNSIYCKSEYYEK